MGLLMKEAKSKLTYSGVRHWSLVKLKEKYPEEYSKIFTDRCLELGVQFSGRGFENIKTLAQKVSSLESELERIKRENNWLKQESEDKERLTSFLENLKDR
jgi:hypothetical protein